MSAVSQDGTAAHEADESVSSLSALLRRRSRRLLGDLLRPHRQRLAFIIGLVSMADLAALVGPWLIGIGIDRGIPALSRRHDVDPLVWIGTAFAVVVVVQALTARAFVREMGQVGEKVLMELRCRLFWHFQRMPVAFHERYTSGRAISRQISDIDSIAALFEEGLDPLVSAVLSLLLVTISMLLLEWKLALVVLAVFSPLVWLTAWFRRGSAVAYRARREAIAQVIVHFVETFGGIRAIQAFRLEGYSETTSRKLNERYAGTSLRSSRLIAVYAPGIILLGNLATVAVLMYGGLLVIERAIQVGILVTFLLYLQRFFAPLEDLSDFYNSFQAATAALEKISAVLEEMPSVAEPSADSKLPARVGAGREIRFEAVRFGYSQQPVFSGLDLRIPGGQTVALVGESGAGKTSLARLTARFYDPDQGRILLDGVSLRELSEQSLRREIFMITQENFLFSGSIADNIELGRPGASRAEIEAAAEAAGASRFISALPERFDALTGNQGSRLSAGQRQLISFARILLAAPSVLVFDEATSLLDIPAERAIQAALRTILAGRTALIIAHRLSTVQIADRVLVMSAGRIVEDGSPSQLLRSAGAYSALTARWQASLP